MKDSSRLKTWLIIINVFFGLCMIPAFFMALMSVMLFDSPGSTESSLTWTLFFSLISFPILCLLSIPFTWVFYKKEKPKAALWVSLSPLFSVLFIIIAFVLLEVFCNGQFNC